MIKNLQGSMVTSITGNDVNAFADAIKDYQNLGILTLAGEIKIENGWEAFLFG